MWDDSFLRPSHHSFFWPRSLPGAALCLSDSFLLGHHPAITPRPLRPRASQAHQLPPGSSSNHIVLREVGSDIIL
ncbi:hypothetical protein AXF42_Ash010402 [Apostasia shenzhenica]|uniref:Uncharacterized protein n=1 Tax=Apostasia shenzhenica TaxID=1088818 RepID=A0A2I0BDW5_9ASPA|nr:hypothetical protein AXF42_Ash010402 [Apostasia shenzhenica]